MKTKEKRIRMIEAMANYAIEHGEAINKTKLACIVWSNTQKHIALLNLHNLTTGKTKRITAKMVHQICEATGVDANFLFGFKS